VRNRASAHASASEGAAVEFYLACYKLLNLDPRSRRARREKAPDANDTTLERLHPRRHEGHQRSGSPARAIGLRWPLAIEASQTEDRDPLLPRSASTGEGGAAGSPDTQRTPRRPSSETGGGDRRRAKRMRRETKGLVMSVISVDPAHVAGEQ
jgi:hypothetical protein